MSGKPRIGISACLLGWQVRYDGGHKRDGSLVEMLGPRVTWVPVCPEAEAGFGTPRDPMRLVARRSIVNGTRPGADDVRLVVIRSGADVTGRLQSWVRRRLVELEQQGLHGFVLKKDSPSCGVERVNVYNSNDAGDAGQPVGRGLFADALITRFPRLPVEDEERLADPALREQFLERVLAYQQVGTSGQAG